MLSNHAQWNVHVVPFKISVKKLHEDEKWWTIVWCIVYYKNNYNFEGLKLFGD